MIKLFTHTDLDGVSCEILGKIAFGEDIDVVRCGYGNIDDKVEEFINIDEEYDKLFITDISVKKKLADTLNNISDKVILLDHHKTALWLTDYHKQCEAYCKKHIDLNNKCPTCAISELYYYTRYDCFDCFVATQLFKDV